MALPNDEHDDDLSPEVREDDLREIERFPQVSEDLDDTDEEPRLDSDREHQSTGLNDDVEDESPDAI